MVCHISFRTRSYSHCFFEFLSDTSEQSPHSNYKASPSAIDSCPHLLLTSDDIRSKTKAMPQPSLSPSIYNRHLSFFTAVLVHQLVCDIFTGRLLWIRHHDLNAQLIQVTVTSYPIKMCMKGYRYCIRRISCCTSQSLSWHPCHHPYHCQWCSGGGWW